MNGGELETKSICQKFGEACRKSTPTRVLPSPALIDRATRQCRSSFVFRFVRISSCEGVTFAESCINPPTALTFRVAVFSENGSSNSHPYTNTGVASATLRSATSVFPPWRAAEWPAPSRPQMDSDHKQQGNHNANNQPHTTSLQTCSCFCLECIHASSLVQPHG